MTDLEKLHDFILAAKSASYVGGGEPVNSCRPASHDLSYVQDPFSYLDSYFGGSDFIGQEVVYANEKPIWAMNYYGVIREPDKVDAPEVGAMIKASLSRMYASGRFLGGWQHREGNLVYYDTSLGDLSYFSGREWIEKEDQLVYELVYHGGMIH